MITLRLSVVFQGVFSQFEIFMLLWSAKISVKLFKIHIHKKDKLDENESK